MVKVRLFKALSFAVLWASALSALAANYSCRVEQKFSSEGQYTDDQLRRARPSIEIENSDNGSFVSRCSFSSTLNEITCDRYKADRIEFDYSVNIQKYYIFKAQFDVQLFSDLSFLENNGRGTISYGRCKPVIE